MTNTQGEQSVGMAAVGLGGLVLDGGTLIIAGPEVTALFAIGVEEEGALGLMEVAHSGPSLLSLLAAPSVGLFQGTMGIHDSCFGH